MDLFMELQVIGDRAVKKLAFSHIVHSIRRMNQKSKNEARNRKLQNTLFKSLQVCNILQAYWSVLSCLIDLLIMPHVSQAEEETRAKRAFTILCDLHRRRVWFDERTTNALCDACFHPSSRYLLLAS
jgi:protein SDA1